MTTTFVPSIISWDSHTETLGTAITEFAPPVTNKRAKITSLDYFPGSTEHDLVLMRCIGEMELTDVDASGQTVIDVVTTTFAIGHVVAADDWLVVQHGDGTYGLYKVTTVSSLDVTITPALTKGVNIGAQVFVMGAPGDTAYHLSFKSGTSALRQLGGDPLGGIIESGYPKDASGNERSGLGDPLMFYSANPTAAGTLIRGGGVYV